MFSTFISPALIDDAKPLEHVGERLRREDRLAAIAGLVQSDDEAVADQRRRCRHPADPRCPSVACRRIGRRPATTATASRETRGDDAANHGQSSQNILLRMRISQPGDRLSFIKPLPK